MSAFYKHPVNTSPDYMEGIVLTATPKPIQPFDPSKKTHADYRCMVGSRRQNTLLANAGLGVSGAFEAMVYSVSWSPGEVVDTERAKKLETVLLHGINGDAEIVCNSVELIRVYQ